MRCITLLAALTVVAGCASQPKPEAVPAKNAATYAPTTLPPATTVEEAIKLGYKIVDQDGKTMYCRETTKLGSHLRKEQTCLTAEELAASRDANQRNFDNMKKYRQPPQGK